MWVAHQTPAFAGYRDEVTELIGAGEPFGEVEDAIDDVGGLTLDEKAALWLLAFSHDQQRSARAQLSVVR
jgi:hypothetical protein